MLPRINQDIMIIDPTNMTDDEAIILNYFFKEQLSLGNHIFEKSNQLPIPHHRINYATDIDAGSFNYLELTHTIIARPSLSHPNEYRFEIYGNEIGSGAYGKVYSVIGTLLSLENHKMILENKARVMKEMKVKPIEAALLKKFVTQEYEMTKRDLELGVKFPIFYKDDKIDEIHSIMAMKFVPGEELLKIVQRDQLNKNKENHIDTDTRIKMSIAVALALEKVHNNNLIHRDVKSANVIINMHSPLIQAKAIDYASSRDKDDSFNFNNVYTPIFAAPEVVGGGTGYQESDVYSACWIFNDIWRGDSHKVLQMQSKLAEKVQKANKPYSLKKYNIKQEHIAKEVFVIAKHCKFKNLFVGIDDLDKIHSQRIELLLKKKTNAKLIKRGDMSEFVAVFEEISLERLIAKIPQVNKSDTINQAARAQYINELHAAHSLGIQIRKSLDKYAKYDNQTITLANMDEIKSLFCNKDSLTTLSERQEVIALFVERLQIMAFVGLTTKQAILAKLCEIVDGYTQSMDALAKIKIQINGLHEIIKDKLPALEQYGLDSGTESITNELTKIENKIVSILKKKRHQITIDKLDLLNTKYQKIVSLLQDNLTLNVDKIDQSIEELSMRSSASSLTYCVQTVKNYADKFGLFAVNQAKVDIPKRHDVNITAGNYRST